MAKIMMQKKKCAPNENERKQDKQKRWFEHRNCHKPKGLWVKRGQESSI